MEEAIRAASKLWGVQEQYWDIFGNQHFASPEVQQIVLESLGVAVSDLQALNSAAERRLRQDWASLVAPSLVLPLSQGWLPVQVNMSSGASSLTLTFAWESGAAESVTHDPSSLEQIGEASFGEERYRRLKFPLPADSTLGYHTVRAQSRAESADGTLILCPEKAYKPEFLDCGGKAAGIAVSLYGVRSRRNWGCGDFTDLYRLADWAVTSLGASFIGLNPLHSIPNRQPYNTSPYLPNCSYYRNPIYIDIESMPDIRASSRAQRILASQKLQTCLNELRASEYVEYEKIWKLKLRFLKIAFREFLREYRTGSERASGFRRYVEAEGDLLHRFAVFCALDETIHKQDRNTWIWPDWPAACRDAASGDVQAFAQEHWRLVLFYKYAQWDLDQQLEAAQHYAVKRGMSIGLYHDLALATDRCGSDLWAHPDFYVKGCRVGSPPDDFSPKGQDWAFPPPNSVCHRESGYRLFVESIRKNLRHGGALRIDHVMRFFRLFWIPDGREASDGLYIHDYSDDLLRILALESVRNQVIVIGEDLGTVEPYIREALAGHGILSYRLLYFEKNRDGSFKLSDEYPRQALVSVSTHDLPTLAGFWLGRDIEARRAAGVLGDEDNYRDQWQSRMAEKQRMLDVMFELKLLPEDFPRNAADVPDFTGQLHNAAVGFLARTPSELMVLSGEDLFKQADQQNLPGTTEQYPNWRGKLRYTLEEFDSDEQARGCALMFRTWLRETNRFNQAAV